MGEEGRRHGLRWSTAAAAALALLAWLPFLRAPLSPDEGGFLLVASQWAPGTSLYGSYWVDRPPLLIALFAVAAHTGGAVALRVMGMAAVVAAILLVDRLCIVATGRRCVTPVLVAAIFLSTPLFGTTEVNGELLAVPLVLLGVACAVRAQMRRGAAVFGWALASGAVGSSAVLVKQNVVDVFVVVTVLGLTSLRRRGARGLVPLAAAAAGALITAITCLWIASARGTDPMMLWSALVEFRGQAIAVIQQSASAATPERLTAMLGSAALSGAPFVVAVFVVFLRAAPSRAATGAPDLRWPAIGLFAWESCAVAAGGSYWLHYLLGLVPGIGLLAVAAAQRPPIRRARVLVAATVTAALVSASSATVVAASSGVRSGDDAAVAEYLEAHSATTDTVVVAFGHPNIVWESGLQSPYEQLWSLPVRVRDSQLHELATVLGGPTAPTWVVVAGASLDTWGVSPAAAQRVLERRFEPEVAMGPYVLWHVKLDAVDKAESRWTQHTRPSSPPGAIRSRAGTGS